MRHQNTTNLKSRLIACLLGAICFVSLANEEQVINLHYHERTPYAMTTEGGVAGILAERASHVFHEAGIHFLWKKTPAKRQMKIIKSNMGLDCGLGWFKTQARESYSRFTSALYQDRPQIALAKADNQFIDDGVSAADILANKQLVLEVKDGYSYGQFLDKLIAQYQPKVDKTSSESRNMIRKIHAGRGDYFFVSPEEAEHLIISSGFPLEDFKLIHFSDVPSGEQRHIWCSRQVDSGVIEKLNRVISTMAIRDSIASNLDLSI